MIQNPPIVVYPPCTDGAGLEETTVQGLYGCWRDLYIWVWQAYDLSDSSWRGAGFDDACNVARPFGKVVNAVFLINYALSDNYIPQWHSTEDYQSSSRAADNRFHGPFYMQLDTSPQTALARAQTGRFLTRDRTKLFCGVFNAASGSNLPSTRAGVLVHESWHHWLYKHDFVTSHRKCGSQDCDFYYFHGSGAYDFGQLDRYDTAPDHLRFHSPYQIEVEFLADLAEMSQPWVPVIVTQAARATGNGKLANRFANAPGYLIGNPRPF